MTTFLIKIQSISDIITNSSSEVFIISEPDCKRFKEKAIHNDCIDVYTLRSLEDVKDNSWITNKYLKENPGSKPEDLIGYAVVSIEDHYDYKEFLTDIDFAEDMCVCQIDNF